MRGEPWYEEDLALLPTRSHLILQALLEDEDHIMSSLEIELVTGLRGHALGGALSVFSKYPFKDWLARPIAKVGGKRTKDNPKPWGRIWQLNPRYVPLLRKFYASLEVNDDI